MRKYREVRWSEVVRKAIMDYLARLEEGATRRRHQSFWRNWVKSLGKV